MRNPNGFGTVARLTGHRRRPFIVKKVTKWKENGHPVYSIIGYAATREEGLMLLSDYNRAPWDVDRAKLTLQQIFDLWKEKKAPKLGESNRSSLCSAFKHSSTLPEGLQHPGRHKKPLGPPGPLCSGAGHNHPLLF